MIQAHNVARTCVHGLLRALLEVPQGVAALVMLAPEQACTTRSAVLAGSSTTCAASGWLLVAATAIGLPGAADG